MTRSCEGCGRSIDHMRADARWHDPLCRKRSLRRDAEATTGLPRFLTLLRASRRRRWWPTPRPAR